MEIALFLSAWGNGGAERQFALMAEGLAARGHEVTAISVLPTGFHWKFLCHSESVNTLCLYPESKDKEITLKTLCGGISRLRKKIHCQPVDILYSGLTVGNFMAALAHPATSPGKLVWGIRNSTIEGSWEKKALAMGSRFISKRPDMVISNSYAGQFFARRRGLLQAPHEVIPNGIDTNRFRPDLLQRDKLRSELGLPPNSFVITSIGRITPAKDHFTLLRALSLLRKVHPHIRLVCLGEGERSLQQSLQRETACLGIQDLVAWHPPSSNPERWHQIADLFCSTSCRGEGLSNSLAEAMACGIPVIATKTGDHARLLQGVGVVVPPKDPRALASAIDQYLRNRHHTSSESIRQKILHHYSLSTMIARTEVCLQKVLSDKS